MKHESPRPGMTGKGSGVHRRHAEQPELTRPSAPSQVRPDPVAAFMPWAQEEERSLRRRLLAFQQRAGTRSRQSEDDRARFQWMLAHEIAAESAFATAPAEHLQEVLQTITRIAMVAGSLERWSDHG